MKNLFVLFVVLSFATLTKAQYVIDNFDSSATSKNYTTTNEGAPSRIVLTDNHTDFKEGKGSLDVNYVIGAFHTWGSYGNLTYRVSNNVTMDWSKYDTLSIMMKVKTASSHPEYLAFRIHLADRPDSNGNIEEYIYENTTLIDKVTDWFELKVPLYERYSDGSVNPNDSGFVRFPSSWNPPAANNWKLDWDKIVGFNLTVTTTGSASTNLPADSVEICYDNMKLFGAKKTPFVFFSGSVVPTYESLWAWGNATADVVSNAGPVDGLNAIKWVQGDQWGSGWSGLGFTITPPFDMSQVWPTDTLKFKMKAESGTLPMRIQFESASAKVATIFTPNTDNEWHSYAFPLKDFTPSDNTTGYDSTKVTTLGIMAEANSIVGKTIYVTEIWTGTPVLDVIPPKPPTEITAIAGSNSNVITWVDVAGETGEVYDVFYSEKPITDLTSPDVNVLKTGILHGAGTTDHPLRAPGTDQTVSYYYAVRCTDAAGNKGGFGTMGAPISNLAKGVVTLTYKSSPFATFKADGKLDEWSGVKPIKMSLTESFKVSNTVVDNDADLSGSVYIAMDADNMYVALDITDDIFSPTTQTDLWLNDSYDLFIGLFDGNGAVQHSAYKRGDQPDYHFRFAKSRLLLDGFTGGDSLIVPGDNYYFEEAAFPKTGWVVEAKIPFATLVAKSKDADKLFVPKEGMRIPIDMELCDADATGSREGQLDYSPYADGNAYSTPAKWSYTWLGDRWLVGVKDNGKDRLVNAYSLAQNYPNPFNPATVIKYSIEKAGHVTIKIFDILGREVSTLVNEMQSAGQHSLKFDASRLTSGVYIYRIESGSYQNVKKMMLVK